MAEMKRSLTTIAFCVALVLTGCGGGTGPATSPPPATSASAPPVTTSKPLPSTPVRPTSVTLNPLTLSTLPPDAPAGQTTEFYDRHFIWEFEDITWNWDVKISEALFRYYKAIPRAKTDNYSIYITYKQDDAMMKEAADEILRAAQSVGLSKIETADMTAAFVQSLPYTLDIKTTGFEEYPKYPIETLVDSCGDCEDKSALLVSLLQSMGYETVLIIFPGVHGAVGIKRLEGMNGAYYEYNGARYYYIETTDAGWQIGEIPNNYIGLKPTFLEIKPVPVLVHEFKASGSGSNLEVTVDVENLGTEDAPEVIVTIGFDDGNDKIINSKEAPKFALPQNQKKSVSLFVQSPAGKHTRLIIEIKAGTDVTRSYSDWFDSP